MLIQNSSVFGSAINPIAKPSWISLNARERCSQVSEFEHELFNRVVAQDDAVLALSQIYQVYRAKMNLKGKPLGTLLFLGPTGSGKTRSVEAAAEVLFGDPNAVIKIDCAEFQHSHEISKLIGSPPGYLGHRETLPIFTQDNLDHFHKPDLKLTLVLFDEIEKASDALWQLMLGILDKATLTLGDNRRIDFSNCIIVLTSNLGAREMSRVTEGELGFRLREMPSVELDARLEKIGVEAARRRFAPEFMNRLDKVVLFRSLTEESMRLILDIELAALQRRILDNGHTAFAIVCSEDLKSFLIREGFDRRYGARPLKRALERYLVLPLSNLIATCQVKTGDVLFVDLDSNGTDLTFRKSTSSTAVAA